MEQRKSEPSGNQRTYAPRQSGHKPVQTDDFPIGGGHAPKRLPIQRAILQRDQPNYFHHPRKFYRTVEIVHTSIETAAEPAATENQEILDRIGHDPKHVIRSKKT